ncbi:hypothetical protein P9112_014188 [Eukaryota sp. TZLM1-RC]
MSHFQYTPTDLVSTLYQSREFYDVVLEYKGQNFSVHRVVVSAFSKYLFKMFCSSFAEEKDMSHIKLHEHHISIDLFQQFLDSLYCQPLAFTEQNVFDLYYLAEYYEAQGIVSHAFSFIEKLPAPALLHVVHRANEVGHFTFITKISPLIDNISFDSTISLNEEALEVLSNHLQTVDAAKWLLKCLVESFKDGDVTPEQVDVILRNLIDLIRQMDIDFIWRELIQKLGEFGELTLVLLNFSLDLLLHFTKPCIVRNELCFSLLIQGDRVEFDRIKDLVKHIPSIFDLGERESLVLKPVTIIELSGQLKSKKHVQWLIKSLILSNSTRKDFSFNQISAVLDLLKVKQIPLKFLYSELLVPLKTNQSLAQLLVNFSIKCFAEVQDRNKDPQWLLETIDLANVNSLNCTELAKFLPKFAIRNAPSLSLTSSTFNQINQININQFDSDYWLLRTLVKSYSSSQSQEDSDWNVDFFDNCLNSFNFEKFTFTQLNEIISPLVNFEELKPTLCNFMFYVMNPKFSQPDPDVKSPADQIPAMVEDDNSERSSLKSDTSHDFDLLKITDSDHTDSSSNEEDEYFVKLPSTTPKTKTTLEPRTNPSVDQQLEERRRRLAAQQSQASSQTVSNQKVKESQKKSVEDQPKQQINQSSIQHQKKTESETEDKIPSDYVPEVSVPANQDSNQVDSTSHERTVSDTAERDADSSHQISYGKSESSEPKSSNSETAKKSDKTSGETERKEEATKPNPIEVDFKFRTFGLARRSASVPRPRLKNFFNFDNEGSRPAIGQGSKLLEERAAKPPTEDVPHLENMDDVRDTDVAQETTPPQLSLSKAQEESSVTEPSNSRSSHTQPPPQTKTASQRFDEAVAQASHDSKQKNQDQLGLDSAHQQHQNPKVQDMINMGFDSKLAERALQKCHNNVELAVDYLVQLEKLKSSKTQRSSRSGDSTLKSSSRNLEQGKPSQHYPAAERVPEQSSSPSTQDKSVHHSNPNIVKFVEMGYEVKRAERVLAICNNDVERAIQYMAPRGVSTTLRSKEVKSPSLSAETSSVSQDSTRSLLQPAGDVVKSQNNEPQRSSPSPPNHRSSKLKSPQQSPLVESTPTSHPVHSDPKVQKLVEMGFDAKDAEAKLRWFRGDIDQAADWLARFSQFKHSRTSTIDHAEPFTTGHLSSRSSPSYQSNSSTTKSPTLRTERGASLSPTAKIKSTDVKPTRPSPSLPSPSVSPRDYRDSSTPSYLRPTTASQPKRVDVRSGDIYHTHSPSSNRFESGFKRHGRSVESSGSLSARADHHRTSSHKSRSASAFPGRSCLHPDEAKLTKLMGMGFQERKAEAALRRFSNNFDLAFEQLLGNL